MQGSKFTQLKIVVLALFLAVSAFASTSKYNMKISSPVSVSGKSLPAGLYSLSWTGTGPDVQVNIMKGKDVVATAPAKLMDLNQKAADDTAILKSNSDGSKSLAEVHFSGKKEALSFDSAMGGGTR
jgi:hypothetical protein